MRTSVFFEDGDKVNKLPSVMVNLLFLFGSLSIVEFMKTALNTNSNNLGMMDLGLRIYFYFNYSRFQRDTDGISKRDV